MAPAKTGKPVIDKLYSALAQTANAPDVKEQFRAQGVDAYLQSSPETFTAFLREELGRWEKVAKESGARAD